jgi:hypothetical protein
VGLSCVVDDFLVADDVVAQVAELKNLGFLVAVVENELDRTILDTHSFVLL